MVLVVAIVDVDLILDVDPMALTLTATFDVESIVDVGRGPTLRFEPSSNAATQVEGAAL